PVPVGQPVHGIADSEPGRPPSQGLHGPRDLVTGDDRTPVVPQPVHPGRGPRELSGGEARRVDADQDVAGPRLGYGSLLVGEALRASLLVNAQRVHRSSLLWPQGTTAPGLW